MMYISPPPLDLNSADPTPNSGTFHLFYFRRFTLVVLVLSLSLLFNTGAAASLFTERRNANNYTFEFVSDGTFVSFQPNMFAGIAAAFHEYNTGPEWSRIVSGASSASFFSLQLINQTAESARIITHNDATTVQESTEARFRNYNANVSALNAYRSTNPSGTMDDYLLSIGADPNDPQDMQARAAVAGVPLGLAGCGGLSSFGVINAVFQSDLTSFGMTSTNVSYQSNRRFINLRGSLTRDFTVIMNVGFHRADLRCTSFLLMHLPIDNIDELGAFLFQVNGYSYDTVSRDDEGPYDLTELAIALAKRPSCIMFVDIAELVESYLPYLQSLTAFDLSEVHVVGFAYNYKAQFDDPSSAKNLVMTQITPHPDDDTSKFAMRANAALVNYFADVPDELYGNASEANCSVVNASVTSRLPVAIGGVCRINDYMKPSPFLEYQMMEGYLIGRLALSAAAVATTIGDGVVNMTTVRDAVFRQRMFLFDDFDLGPYTDACSAGGVFPCSCTTGVRSMYTSRVNGTTGRSFAIKDRAELGERNITTSTLSYSQCKDTDSATTRRSINIVYIDLDLDAAEEEGSQSQFPQYQAFSTSLSKALSHYSINDFYSSGSIFLVQRTLTLAEYQSESAVLEIVAELSARYQPFVIATSFSANEQLPNASVAAKQAGFVEMRGIGLREQSDDSTPFANDISVDASLAELVHGAAAVASAHGSNVLIVADTIASGELAVLSLHTFGVQESGVLVSEGGSTCSARDVVTSHVGNGGVVLVSSMSTATVQSVLEGTLELNENPSGAVYICAPEALVYKAATTVASNALGRNFSTIVSFASGMKAWWTTTSQLGQRTSQFQYDDNMGGGNNSLTFITNPVHAKAAYFASVVYAVASQAMNTAHSNAPTFTDTLYSVGSLDAASIPLGPFSNASCTTVAQRTSTDRTCECQNGLTTVFLHSLNQMLSGDGVALNTNTQRFSGCSISYVALPQPSSSDDSTNLLIGVVLGVIGAMLLIAVGIVVVYFYFFAGRNNKNAPKDEAEPFTIVFTDIQASTMIWARAASSMASSVDLHHELLRQVLFRHNGYEVKTIGDSFMIAFRSATEAVKFAADAQRALFKAKWDPAIDQVYRDITLGALEDHLKYSALAASGVSETGLSNSPNLRQGGRGSSSDFNIGSEIKTQHNPSYLNASIAHLSASHTQLVKEPLSYKNNWCGLRVRIGVHTGIGNIKKDEVSGGYDYYGTIVNTAARVEGVGHGGQILITDKTYKELDEVVLRDFGCVAVDLGDQPLRGLDATVQLFQLDLTDFSGRTYLPLRLDIDWGNDSDTTSDEGDEVIIVNTASDTFESTPGLSQLGTHSSKCVEDFYKPEMYIGQNSTATRETSPAAVVESDRKSTNTNLCTFSGTTIPGVESATKIISLEDFFFITTTMYSAMSALKTSEILESLAKTWRVRLAKERSLLRLCKKRAVANRAQKGSHPSTLSIEVMNKFHIIQLLEKVHPILEINKNATAPQQRIRESSVRSFDSRRLIELMSMGGSMTAPLVASKRGSDAGAPDIKECSTNEQFSPAYSSE